MFEYLKFLSYQIKKSILENKYNITNMNNDIIIEFENINIPDVSFLHTMYPEFKDLFIVAACIYVNDKIISKVIISDIEMWNDFKHNINELDMKLNFYSNFKNMTFFDTPIGRCVTRPANKDKVDLILGSPTKSEHILKPNYVYNIVYNQMEGDIKLVPIGKSIIGNYNGKNYWYHEYQTIWNSIGNKMFLTEEEYTNFKKEKK